MNAKSIIENLRYWCNEEPMDKPPWEDVLELCDAYEALATGAQELATELHAYGGTVGQYQARSLRALLGKETQ